MFLTSLLLVTLVTSTGCTSPTPKNKSEASAPPVSSIQSQEAEASITNTRESVSLELIKTYNGFSSPTAVVSDKDGNIYVSNWGGSTVSKIDTNGNQTDFVVDMSSPAGLTFDNAGNLYIADYSKDVIYCVTPTGEKKIFAEGLHTPTGISFNKNGSLLVSNRGSNEIVEIDREGNPSILTKEMSAPVGVIEDADQNLFVTNYGGSVKKITADGNVTDFSNEFSRPGVGIDIGPNGEIFAADNGESCVRQIFTDGTTEIILDNIGGCVGVKVSNNILYVTSWTDGAVYAYFIN